MKSKLVTFLVLAFGIYLIVNISRTILYLWGKEERVVRVEKAVDELQKKKEELRKRLGEVRSEEFAEREARDKLGMAKPGELVVILSDNDAQGSRLLAKSFAFRRAGNAQDEEKNLAVWREWVSLFR